MSQFTTIGQLLNVLVGALEPHGVEPEPASVDETGFTITIGGHLLRIGFIPVGSGGSPEWFAPSEQDWADARSIFGDSDRQISDDERTMIAAGRPVV